MGRNHLAYASGDAINAVFRRRLQLSSPARMVEAFVAQNPDRSRPSRPAQIA